MTRFGKFKDYKICLIAATLMKYITFRLKQENSNVQLAFIDFLLFLPASLDKLTNNVEEDQFKLLKDCFSGYTALLTRKCVYPYEYFDTFEKKLMLIATQISVL